MSDVSMFSLEGKTMIVTGASKGIGLAIAEGFAREGAKVSICARNTETLEQARAQIAGHGGVVHATPCDVSDSAALEAYMAAAHEALGDVHVLVNNPSGFGMDDDEEGGGPEIGDRAQRRCQKAPDVDAPDRRLDRLSCVVRVRRLCRVGRIPGQRRHRQRHVVLH